MFTRGAVDLLTLTAATMTVDRLPPIIGDGLSATLRAMGYTRRWARHRSASGHGPTSVEASPRRAGVSPRSGPPPSPLAIEY